MTNNEWFDLNMDIQHMEYPTMPLTDFMSTILIIFVIQTGLLVNSPFIFERTST